MRISKEVLATVLAVTSVGVHCTLLHARNEQQTVEAATDIVRSMAVNPLKGMPPVVLREAAGVAIIPNVIKAGLVIDERFGRGVVLVREAYGWSHPVFVTIKGHGVGLQAGIESTDLVLVFKTKASLDRALRGRLTLGADASVAAGPVGHEVEHATDRGPFRAEIFTYSRTRGLFAGLSLEGATLHLDPHANDAFYSTRGCRTEDVLARRGPALAPVVALQAELARLTGTPPAPPGVVPAAVFVPAPVQPLVVVPRRRP